MRTSRPCSTRRRAGAIGIVAVVAVWTVVNGVAPAHAAAPDLVVTAVAPVVSGTQATGSEVTFKATIKNQGDAATPAGVIHGVAFAVNGTTVAWSDASTASLAPGASRTLTAHAGPDGNGTWTAATGSWTLRARVDDVRRIGESNESNNDRTTPLTVAPVKAVTGLTATAAVTPEQFDADPLLRTVRVSWSVPSGQPVGTVYTVTEHPTDYGHAGWCDPAVDLERVTTAGTSATFQIETGHDCQTHRESRSVTYSVTARSTAGGPSATSPRTAPCVWDGDYYGPYSVYSFDCGGVSLYEVDSDDSKLDVGGARDHWTFEAAWEADKHFTGGTAHTTVFPDLDPALHTSRWGFSRYAIPVAPGPTKVVISMVEPTFAAPGRRVFDLRVNGVVVGRDIDIYAEVGRGRLHCIEADVDARGGVVEIVPTSKVDNPIIAAVELGESALGCPTPAPK